MVYTRQELKDAILSYIKSQPYDEVVNLLGGFMAKVFTPEQEARIQEMIAEALQGRDSLVEASIASAFEGFTKKMYGAAS